MNLEPNNLFNVFLIGYRCTGKSSVGKSLATKLGRPFSDTDFLVVSENDMSIKEIVDTYGWETFRRMEHAVVKEVCILGRRVVATGGGIVLDTDNVKLMKTSGRIIWLRASPETIKARMLQDQASEALRPALSSTDSILEIEETLAQRAPLYQQAMDFAVDTDNVRLDTIVDFIIENLKKLDPAIFC
jgi:shikimate kinase